MKQKTEKSQNCSTTVTTNNKSLVKPVDISPFPVILDNLYYVTKLYVLPITLIVYTHV